MAGEQVTAESTLSHAAAKLYIHLLRVGHRYETTPQLLRGAGIRDRRTLRNALSELENKGFLGSDGVEVGTITTNVGTIPTNVGTIPNNVGTIPIGNDYHQVGTIPTNVVAIPTDDFDALIAQADALPADGPETLRTSNFAIRRACQIERLQQAWSSIFPSELPLPEYRAKVWLRLGRGAAYPAYQAMHETASRKNVQLPAAYIEKMLPDIAAKLTREPSPARAPEPATELGTEREPTPEYLEQLTMAQQRAALLGIDWEDDE